MADGQRDTMTLKRLNVWGDVGDTRGLVMNSPTMMLHLAGGDDHLAIRHPSTLFEYKNDGSDASVNVGTSTSKAEVLDGVIVQAIEIHRTTNVVNQTGVGTVKDMAIGPTIKQGSPLFGIAGKPAAGVGRGMATRVIGSGR